MEKGVSLYFAILILSVLSAGLLALVTISVSQIKVIWTLGDSVNAFYGADTGVEEALYRIRQLADLSNFSGSFNGVSYQVSLNSEGLEIVIKSIGSYQKTKRAIETRQ